MSTPILATKLYIPLIRQPHTVLRPRLINRLNAGLQGKLTLISAPAGFGKTTLVSEWIGNSDYPACWFSLDEGDSDPVRFLSYLVASLQAIGPQIGVDVVNLLGSPHPPSIVSLMTPLLNEITTIEHSFMLVLDDYHVIDSQEIDAALTFLVDNQPPQMHLVIMTREDPLFPLARLRARRELNEIRITDLRFTQTEATEFLNQSMGLVLSDEAVATLEARTEGWIAGLQMAAISMTGRTDVDAFLRSFTGSHRFIMDYLIEEVLQRQSERVRSFLFQTAMLERLTGDLCDAITEQDDGQEILELLESSNMLIFPLDDQRHWYRYHHLFAEVLRTYALKHQPDLVSIWQHRASVWYEQNGFRIDAIRHAFASDDLERAADLIERTWPEMFYGVRPMTWLGWAMKLPDEMIRVRPVLSAACAWMLLDKGELEHAEARLRDVEQWLDVLANAKDRQETTQSGMMVANEAEFRTLPASTASARAYLAQAHGNLPSTISHAQCALSFLSENDHFWRGNTALFLGLAQWASGDLESAHRSMTESVDSQRKAGSHYFETFGTVILADIRVTQGRLREARHHYEQALQLVSPEQQVDEAQAISQDAQVKQGPVELYIGLGELYREWGDLDTAAYYLRSGQAVLDRAVLPGSAYRLSCTMARVKEAQGDLDGAFAHLDEARRLYQRAAVPDLYPIPALMAKVWMRQDRLIEALEWVRGQGLSVNDELSFLNEFEYLTFARILIAKFRREQIESDVHQASQLLDRLLHEAETSGRIGSVIAVSVLQAIAQQLLGDISAALTHLDRAVSLAEPEGYVQVFVDEGAAIQSLLARNLTQSAHPSYTGYLIGRIRDDHEADSDETDTNQLLIEPLSNRELEVLQLLANGSSNQEVADELIIALSTVKKHVNNIFGKINVTNRTQAVNRARELKLI